MPIDVDMASEVFHPSAAVPERGAERPAPDRHGTRRSPALDGRRELKMDPQQELAVLFVEDSESDAALATRALEHAGYAVLSRRVQDPDAMAVALGEGHWDVVLCDHVLPGFDSLAALEIVAASGSDTPLIVVSGAVGEERPCHQ
jgi:CheY-like chemotaxis protein